MCGRQGSEERGALKGPSQAPAEEERAPARAVQVRREGFKLAESTDREVPPEAAAALGSGRGFRWAHRPQGPRSPRARAPWSRGHPRS